MWERETMSVRMPVREVRVPAGDGTWQVEQTEEMETLTIPAVAEPGDEAAPGRTQVWDGRDVSFPPLRPSAGRPVQSG